MNKKLISHIFFLTAFIAGIVIFPHPAVSRTRDVTLKNIVIANSRDNLLAYFTVDKAFTDKINDALLKGVPISFSFFISIHKKRDAWLDKKIVDMKISNTLKYNTLKQEFTIVRPWEGGQPFVTKSMEEAKTMMCDVYSLTIAPLNLLRKGEQYRIGIKAETNRSSQPRYLQYLLLFVSMWKFETRWYEVNIIY
ncbi:MAG: DUF4390 domain-containing protein [Desulfamplus sp.]|nr:DUF4390 domain-containing protein [Desulfamplus sp.]